ncbi:MAG: carbonic anhydrase [Nitrococcus mobilis]|nr:carbonic anhydrase [Nitrococcus mobilis]
MLKRLNIKKVDEGIRRFQETVFPARRKLFEKLAGGQSPQILWITCSDSRVDPALITQTEPGELFVLRNAGNIVPPYATPHRGSAATIEFAVQVLGVQHVIVCGHSDCGAIKGCLNPAMVETLPAVREWLRYTDSLRERVVARFGRADGPEPLERAIQQNALDQLEHLKTHASIAEALAANKLQLHAWYYQIATGDVSTCSNLDSEAFSTRRA